ncbi:MAG: HAD-IIB family hydrolase [Gammaproteobacteria bacterium]|uniref:HAD-IIB family hydrolase n=1 Tax=Rhodoferax sp. TaxID=50421 RepID=UPI0017B50A11|nr:HAD-IIB family hydrolase [Rhodoferax sp.]MBU3899445.1 HAD-IIB family hydrolase [Gammaproteobacteria bacterium]MBA3057255.1 HAD-IIB family hydrolase [Rhodoferax sp.]MBU3996349.1 HAD-IIB family hydrolase [Gammaproteobacteria bacterium]MBU4080700.1 HAD-IIB family hydrolase [Gammaproteobacteria bacterium]MBU4113510.1 HAD-IIB family hydrolase [Gammaproteobacteria bacterium]
MPKTIIFSDLDGTLLDEATYTFESALPALDVIRAQGIALVLCSSKTRAELLHYRQRLHNDHPYISENGGGIFVPAGNFTVPLDAAPCATGECLITLGTPHSEIRRQFVALRQRLCVPVRGFTDMTVGEVAALTGLDLEEAALAKARDFDEPFVFGGAPEPAFLQAIEDAGLHWTQGRIFHIMGAHDKGLAVRRLLALYKQQYGRVTSIALGDSLNDLPMLQAVDRPVLVRHANGSFDPRIDIAGLTRTHSPGPLGWNEALLSMLSSQNSHQE